MAITPNQPTGFAADDLMAGYSPQEDAGSESGYEPTQEEQPEPRVVSPGTPAAEAMMKADEWARSLYPDVEEPKMEGSKDVSFNIPLLPKTVFGRRVFGRGFKGLKLPIHLSGAGLDAAASAIADEMRTRKVPGTAAQEFFSGVIGGYAQSRASDLAARKKAYEEQKKAYEDNAKKREEFRKFATQELFKTGLVQKDSKPVLAYTNFSALPAEAQRAIASRNQIPPPDAEGKRMIPIDWLKGPTPTSPIQTMQARLGLAEAYKNTDRVKHATAQSQFRNKIMELASMPRSNNRDTALLYTLSRAYDERTGVRQEELRLFMEAQGLWNKLVNMPRQLTGGGFLDDSSVEQIKAISNALTRQSFVWANQTRDAYLAEGRRIGEDMSMMLPSFSFTESGFSTAPGSSSTTLQPRSAATTRALNAARGGR